MPTLVITHRGLDPSKPHYFAESSKEAFLDQLQRGYGVEFDVRRTRDNQFVVIHDSNLARLSKGQDERPVQDLALEELLALEFEGSHLTSLPTLLDLIEERQAPDSISALHLKAASQEREALDLLLAALRSRDVSRFVVFDVTKESSFYLKERLPALQLVPSVAHPYDIERYNAATGNTLFSLDEVIASAGSYFGVWLDEWDLADRDGGRKTFYNEATFAACREAGLKIFLVTPELHATSPGLLGGEAHEDARDHETLMRRIKGIIALNPDGICTDYPDEVRAIAEAA